MSELCCFGSEVEEGMKEMKWKRKEKPRVRHHMHLDLICA